ncbi:MAG: redoxin domain-containing protein [Dysosmobacter sp.]
MQKFPAFEGKDLNGNTVKSDELFSANAVTVVNFWFTTCNPCVGELSELDALNKELAEEGRRYSSASTPSRWAAMKRPFPRQRIRSVQEGRHLSECLFRLRRRGRKVYCRMCSPTPPPMWWTAAATSWGDPIVGAITDKSDGVSEQPHQQGPVR